jgi:hypothetical protein
MRGLRSWLTMGRIDKLAKGPHVIGDPERHRWRHPQRFVRAAQIVELSERSLMRTTTRPPTEARNCDFSGTCCGPATRSLPCMVRSDR